MNVLKNKADELMVPLEVAMPLNHEQLDGVELSLSGDHQFTNAGLAVSLCKCWLQRTGNWVKFMDNDAREDKLPQAFLRGLSSARLPGRAQIVYDIPPKSIYSETTEHESGELIFYLDGAHSPESMEACANWFSSAVKENNKPSVSSSSVLRAETLHKLCGNGYALNENMKSGVSDKTVKRVLLFNCMDIRDPEVLLAQLANTRASAGTHFSKAIFVPSLSTYSKVTSGASVIDFNISSSDLSWQYKLERIWEKIICGQEEDPIIEQKKNAKVDSTMTLLPSPEWLYEEGRPCTTVIPSLPLTIKWLRECVEENPSLRVQVLVTGSLHLVGDVLKLLRR